MSKGNVIAVSAVVLSLTGFSWIHAQQGRDAKFTLEDYYEIQNLYYTYAHSIDAGQGERFASTWIESGEFTHGYGPGQGGGDRAPAKGTAALTRVGSTGGSRHFVANLIITPTPEGAKGSCYLLLYSARTVPPSFTETAIYDDTKTLQKAIEDTPDKKPRPRDKQAALKLATSETETAGEVTKAIDSLVGDGSVVAFTEVFQQLRDDMKRVQGRLEKGDLGTPTQAMQEDILATLKEMIRSLKSR